MIIGYSYPRQKENRIILLGRDSLSCVTPPASQVCLGSCRLLLLETSAPVAYECDLPLFRGPHGTRLFFAFTSTIFQALSGNNSCKRVFERLALVSCSPHLYLVVADLWIRARAPIRSRTVSHRRSQEGKGRLAQNSDRHSCHRDPPGLFGTYRGGSPDG